MQKDVEVLEKVQKKAVGMVAGLTGQCYEEKLAELGLQSLENRRLEADLSMVYKVLNGLCEGRDWFEKLEGTEQGTRASTDGHSLRTPFARLELRKNFFTVRATEAWNKLPLAIRAAKSVRIFKKSLRAHLEPTSEVDGAPIRR